MMGADAAGGDQCGAGRGALPQVPAQGASPGMKVRHGWDMSN